MKEWITYRNDVGAYDCLMNDVAITITDPAGFKNFIGMSLEDFEFLASKMCVCHDRWAA